MPQRTVYCLLPVTAADGEPEMLVGTADGIARVRAERVLPFPASLRLPDNRIRCLRETRSRGGVVTLWIGTENGLARYTDGKTTVFDAESGLANNGVISLLEVDWPDGRREMWAGTRGGVSRCDLDAKEPTWSTISTATLAGFPNNTIYRLERDARGRIYVFTNRGVAQLTRRSPPAEDGAEFSVYVFSTEDGLPSNECNTGASMVDSHGRIWAGTIGGVGIFDPAVEIDDRVAETVGHRARHRRRTRPRARFGRAARPPREPPPLRVRTPQLLSRVRHPLPDAARRLRRPSVALGIGLQEGIHLARVR